MAQEVWWIIEIVAFAVLFLICISLAIGYVRVQTVNKAVCCEIVRLYGYVNELIAKHNTLCDHVDNQANTMDQTRWELPGEDWKRGIRPDGSNTEEKEDDDDN